MESLVLELSLIIGIAAVLALIAKFIKQPTLIAYIITGIVVGPLVLNLLQSEELIGSFAHIGVAFLLFVVGLSLDFRILKQVGQVALVAGVAEILLVSVVGFGVAVLLGFTYVPALFIAAALAFSSTVVVVKLLTDNNEIDTLHGRIALGILILQDFVAAVLLMMVPVVSGGGSYLTIFLRFGDVVFLIGSVFVFARFLLPKALSIASRNQEVLFLLSVAWALLIAVLFDYLGFSLEIGALLAGMALASSKFNLEIQGKIKGLRDFFVILFFVFFGSQLIGPLDSTLIFNAVTLSLFVLIIKPVTIMGFMKLMGYKKRTNFFTGLSLSQVSEFSLILILTGFSLGLIGQELLSLIILVTLVTIAISSYGVYYANSLFSVLSGILTLFDGHGNHEIGRMRKRQDYDVILLGYNRIGFNLLKSITKAKKKYLVVDYNPTTILDLSARGIPCVYGDVNDLELLKELHLNKAKTVISTIPNLDVNLRALSLIKDKGVAFIPTSHNINDSMLLYDGGASYVIMPHFLGGAHVAHMLDKHEFKKSKLTMEGKKQIKELRQRMLEGHEHPQKDHFGK